ncbi:hypothetical protein BU15DRAFT_68057 [Melanogaster broomeanus]|nr:hypothetical protein BU15DRAFT_68057 [Melanogaster broomeanus]
MIAIIATERQPFSKHYTVKRASTHNFIQKFTGRRLCTMNVPLFRKLENPDSLQTPKNCPPQHLRSRQAAELSSPHLGRGGNSHNPPIDRLIGISYIAIEVLAAQQGRPRVARGCGDCKDSKGSSGEDRETEEHYAETKVTEVVCLGLSAQYVPERSKQNGDAALRPVLLRITHNSISGPAPSEHAMSGSVVDRKDSEASPEPFRRVLLHYEDHYVFRIHSMSEQVPTLSLRHGYGSMVLNQINYLYKIDYGLPLETSNEPRKDATDRPSETRSGQLVLAERLLFFPGLHAITLPFG